jgi:hypothetical protein
LEGRSDGTDYTGADGIEVIGFRWVIDPIKREGVAGISTGVGRPFLRMRTKLKELLQQTVILTISGPGSEMDNPRSEPMAMAKNIEDRIRFMLELGKLLALAIIRGFYSIIGK